MNTLVFVIFAIFGACIGSFLTMAFYRIPLNEDIVLIPSHCTNCGKKLKARSLIPIISYFIQGGKCLECGKTIPFFYPAIEIINTVAYALIYKTFGFTFRSLFLGCLFSVVFLIILIDLKYLEIPTFGLIALSILAILFIIFNMDIDALFALISAVIYFIFIKISTVVLEYKFPNKEFLGGGDEKLSLICGLFLGIRYIGIFYFLTGFLGVISSFIWKKVKQQDIFPFAPAMLISLFIIVVYLCEKMG